MWNVKEDVADGIEDLAKGLIENIVECKVLIKKIDELEKRRLIENIVECKDPTSAGEKLLDNGLIENIVECKDQNVSTTACQTQRD